MHAARICGVLLLLAGTACTPPPELEPAPRANETPGVGEGATSVEHGVTVEARAGAWSGAPAALQTEVTPMLVKITNGGPVPIRIQYDELHLVSRTGRMFAAIPPFDVKGAVTQRITSYVSPITSFTVAPYLSGYYPDLMPAVVPFAYDPVYYDNYYTTFVERELPTADMVQRALPEGVLGPGGSIGGFVYFEHIGDDVAGATFRADLVNARTGAQFGMVTIPFVVERAE